MKKFFLTFLTVLFLFSASAASADCLKTKGAEALLDIVNDNSVSSSVRLAAANELLNRPKTEPVTLQLRMLVILGSGLPRFLRGAVDRAAIRLLNSDSYIGEVLWSEYVSTPIRVKAWKKLLADEDSASYVIRRASEYHPKFFYDRVVALSLRDGYELWKQGEYLPDEYEDKLRKRFATIIKEDEAREEAERAAEKEAAAQKKLGEKIVTGIVAIPNFFKKLLGEFRFPTLPESLTLLPATPRQQEEEEQRRPGYGLIWLFGLFLVALVVIHLPIPSLRRSPRNEGK